MSDETDYRKFFKMPTAISITKRISTLTNAFANALVPAVQPTSDEVREALTILDMLDGVECSYCGDGCTEWEHLRPVVLAKRPTGYISEIHNLVPSCGKCNQSKGNKNWLEWMYGKAKGSPKTREIADIDRRAELLTKYENWLPPTKLDFRALAGEKAWAEHWANYDDIVKAMREAQELAKTMRGTIRDSYLESEQQT